MANYQLNAVSAVQITNLYLYGTLGNPSDKTASDIVRDALLTNNDQVTLTLNGAAYMTQGGGVLLWAQSLK